MSRLPDVQLLTAGRGLPDLRRLVRLLVSGLRLHAPRLASSLGLLPEIQKRKRYNYMNRDIILGICVALLVVLLYIVLR